MSARHDEVTSQALEPVFQDWLSKLRLGERVEIDGTELWPLVHQGNGAQPYLLLAEALATGRIEVVEHAGGGVVSEVVAVSRAAAAILILEGDTLVGAKQNRVVVRTVLVPPQGTVPVPVGCVERGRWGGTSPGFGIGEVSAEPSLRVATVLAANQSVASGQRPRSDQTRLWAQVALTLTRRQVHSRTSDYHLGLAKEARRYEKHLEGLAPQPGQVGVLALRQGGLLGLELLGHPNNWQAVARRRLASFVIAASLPLDPALDPGTVRGTPDEWLRAVDRAALRVAPSAGLGEDVSLEGNGLEGAGLWHDGHPAHLAVFGRPPRS